MTYDEAGQFQLNHRRYMYDHSSRPQGGCRYFGTLGDMRKDVNASKDRHYDAVTTSGQFDSLICHVLNICK